MTFILEPWVFPLALLVSILLLASIFSWEIGRQNKKRLEKRRRLKEKQSIFEERKKRFQEIQRKYQKLNEEKYAKEGSKQFNRQRYANSSYSSTEDTFLKDIGKGLKNMGRDASETVKDLGDKTVDLAIMGLGLMLLAFR